MRGASKQPQTLVKKTESKQPQGARKGSTSASGAKKALKPNKDVLGKRPQKATNVAQPKKQQSKRQQNVKSSLPKLSMTGSGGLPKEKRTIQGSATSHTKTKGITPPSPRSQLPGKPAPRKAATSQTQTNLRGKSKSPLKLQPRQVVVPRRDLKSLKTDQASVIKQTLEAKRKAAGLLAGVGKNPGLGKATVSGGTGKSKEASKGTIKKAATGAEKKKISTNSKKSSSKAKRKTPNDEVKGTWWLPSMVQRFVTTLLSWSQGELSRQTVKSVSDSHDDCFEWCGLVC